MCFRAATRSTPGWRLGWWGMIVARISPVSEIRDRGPGLSKKLNPSYSHLQRRHLRRLFPQAASIAVALERQAALMTCRQCRAMADRDDGGVLEPLGQQAIERRLGRL